MEHDFAASKAKWEELRAQADEFGAQGRYKEAMKLQEEMKKIEAANHWDVKELTHKVARLRHQERKVIRDNEGALAHEYEVAWKTKVNELKAYYSALFKEMAERQALEIRELEKSYLAQKEDKPAKWSKATIDLMTIEATLAKQRLYSEAYRAQKKVQHHQALDFVRWRSDLARQFQTKVQNITKKHQQEIDVLERRLEKDLLWAEQVKNDQLLKLSARVRTVQGRLEKHWGTLQAAGAAKAAAADALKLATQAAADANRALQDFNTREVVGSRPVSAATRANVTPTRGY